MFKPTNGEGPTLRANVAGGRLTAFRRLAVAPLKKVGMLAGPSELCPPTNARLHGGDSRPSGFVSVVKASRPAYGFLDRRLSTRLMRNYGSLASAPLRVAAGHCALSRRCRANSRKFELPQLLARPGALTSKTVLCHRTTPGAPGTEPKVCERDAFRHLLAPTAPTLPTREDLQLA